MSYSYRLAITLVTALLLLTGCQLLQPEEDGTAVDAEQTVPAPTVTPIEQVESEIPVAQATMAATAIPIEPVTDTVEGPVLLPTPTPTLNKTGLEVTALSVNVRSGPGTEYDVIAVVGQNEEFGVIGRTEAGDWWQACCFGGELGWFFAPLVEVAEPDSVPIAEDIPLIPLPTPTPDQPEQQSPETEPPVEAPAEQPTAPPEEQPAAESQEQSTEPSAPDAMASAGTAGEFNPAAQYQIVDYRVLGFDDNNGGIFNKGGQQIIFVTVLDENGNGVEGAIVKDAVGDKLNVSVGSKGPGKAEIKMDWDPYKLYVAEDSSGPVTSQTSNQMNNPYPHIPDVVGKLGPADNEYAICPTVDDRCEPPFYHAHWSYVITFQKAN